MLRKLTGLLIVFGSGLAVTGCGNTYTETCGVPGTVTECACYDNTRGTLMCEASGNPSVCAQGCTCWDGTDGVLPCEFAGGLCEKNGLDCTTDPAANGAGTGTGTGSGGSVTDTGGSAGIPGTGGSPGTGGNPGNPGTGGSPDTGPPVTGTTPFGACGSAADCDGDDTCRVYSSMTASHCAGPCRDTTDCALGEGGDAPPICQSSGPFGRACQLSCDGGESCPPGMECFPTTFGPLTCGWRR